MIQVRCARPEFPVSGCFSLTGQRDYIVWLSVQYNDEHNGGMSFERRGVVCFPIWRVRRPIPSVVTGGLARRLLTHWLRL